MLIIITATMKITQKSEENFRSPIFSTIKMMGKEKNKQMKVES